MFRQYIKTALRNLVRNRTYTLVNFTGLSVGIAAVLLIFLVVQFEGSFDDFHTKKDRIYRVISANHGQDGMQYFAGVPWPLAGALRTEYPQLEQVAAVHYVNGAQIVIPGDNGEGGKKFRENILYADPAFFGTFDFKVLAGDTKTSLSEPYSVMLSRETAGKYFGDWRTAMGKTLRVNDRFTAKVAGILEDVPANTDFPLKIVASYATLKSAHLAGDLNDWITTNSQNNCFVVLPSGASPEQFSTSLNVFVRKHRSADAAKDGVTLQPLRDLHYNGQLETFSGVSFSRDLISALQWIGLFLLVIACINFINLATAQAVNRAREVGVRKVLGSSRRQLLLRFMAETGLITFCALLASVLIAVPMLTPLNSLLKLHLSFDPLAHPSLLFFLVSVLVLVTGLSGFYPALVLSGFNPITALKSKIAVSSNRAISLRRGLVVLQFVIAQVLIIGVLVIVSQMNYFRNADLGFNKEAVVKVAFPADSLGRSKQEVIRRELQQQPGVEAVSYSFAAPTDDWAWNAGFRYDNAPKETDWPANMRVADTGYFRLYHLQMVAGRIYHPSDTMKEFVVNETCLKRLGVTDPQTALGKKLDFFDGKHVGFIVGVVKDFHVNSLRDPLSPVVMSTWKNIYYAANIKLQPGKTKETLAAIERLWNKNFPAAFFDYQFLDEKIAGFYDQENQLSWLYKVFAGIAIFISCLGLYGLISFMAVQRNKEIGIRKVLGASAGNIVYLLSREFTELILIAFLIASPLGWYFMHQWLQQYSYRITLGPGLFVIMMLSSVAIAWLTVGYRAFRTAIANPVISLRDE